MSWKACLAITLKAQKSIHLIAILMMLSGLLLLPPPQPIAADLSPGTLDTGFDPGSGTSTTVYDTAIQSDGKVLIGGTFTHVNGTPRPYVVRLNADGTLDTAFSATPNLLVYTLAAQPDGKVLIGGDFTQVDGTARGRIARLNADGSLDTGFDPGSGTDGRVYTIVRQEDGKLLIGGDFTQVNGISRHRVARLNADGSLDTDFNPGSGPDARVRDLAVGSGGKVVIGGDFTQVSGTARAHIARLNADGSLDTSFNPGSGANDPVYALARESDDKVIIGGKFTQVGGTAHAYIARLNAGGTLDTGFNPGSGANHYVYAVALQDNGAILIGGWFTQVDGKSRGRVARLQDNGAVDASFDPGDGANQWVYTLALQPNGQLLIGGSFSEVDGVARAHIARLNGDGTLDDGFDGNPNDTIYTVAKGEAGRVIAGGSFTQVEAVSQAAIARLHADGSLDTSFDPGPGANGAIHAAVLQTDGKVIAGGAFTQISGTVRTRVARLNADGTLDSGFNTSNGPTDTVRALALQSNGKVIIGGDFTHVGGSAQGYLARLNTGGGLDSGFAPTVNGPVSATLVQADGKILIGGNFNQVNGTSRAGIARIENNGTLDTGFNPGSGANGTVQAIAMQTDSKALIGGTFTQVNGVARQHIARLNANGTLDSSFSPTMNGAVYAIAVQADGKIMVSGAFTEVSGTTRSYIARLNKNGTVDTGFDPGSGPNGTVRALNLREDGKVIIGGNFTQVNGEAHPHVARLNVATAPTITSADLSDLTPVGIPYSHAFTASGYPLPAFHVTEGELPPGLTLAAQSGLLSGTPAAFGSYRFTVTVSNGFAPNAMQVITLTNGCTSYLPYVLRQ